MPNDIDYFDKKTPSHMYDGVLNTSLNVAEYWEAFLNSFMMEVPII